MKLLIQRTLSLLPVLTLVVVLLHIVVSHQISILSRHLVTVEEQIASEQAGRELLTIQVAAATSLSSVRERAEALGFRPPERNEVLHISSETLPVALSTAR